MARRKPEAGKLVAQAFVGDEALGMALRVLKTPAMRRNSEPAAVAGLEAALKRAQGKQAALGIDGKRKK